MRLIRKLLYLKIFIIFFISASGQRIYKSSSVLASGNWYKIAISAPGVYKIDISLLNSLGIGANIPSSQIRLFGNGGSPLPEANFSTAPDDLEENALWVEDGGDGVLNGNDYILFYAEGPDHWIEDSVSRKFTHLKNLYSDQSYYFLSVGGNGLRISQQGPQTPASVDQTSFDEHYFHELDTVNFLSSGKEWYGEEFSSSPGRSLSRNFALPFSGILPGQATLVTDVAARSVNTPSSFHVAINGQPVQQLDVAAIGTSLYEVFAQSSRQTSQSFLTQNTAYVSFTYTPGSFNSQGWLNWFEFFCRRNLDFDGQQLLFRDWNTLGSGTSNFLINGAGVNAQVWDVTDPLHPQKMNSAVSAGKLHFTNETQKLHEYVCFSNIFLQPKAIGRVANQNLHNSTPKDLLLVTAPEFLAEAQRLAQLHQQQGNLNVLVATTEQVYNEFSSGSPDPSAIRNFAKMYYDRYRNTWQQSGKYLLLLGRASFDYKNRVSSNTNFVPAYESPNALDPLSTYTSDDFFGFLDDQEDINSTVVLNQLDLGVGRVPAKSQAEAKNFVDKVSDYLAPSSLGPWRNSINLVADDEDNNLHLQDAETLAATVSAVAPEMNQQKIYLDAFQQESGSAGGRYPQANVAVNSNIINGTLIWNFSGHGGPERLAEEVVIDQQIVNGWSNRFRLPLFITATCDFAPYDNPLQNSLGENLLVRPQTGAIALMTTTRVVFAFSNRLLNNNYLRFALQPDGNGHHRSLGQSLMEAKNYTYQTSPDLVNNRKFGLLGDPALTLAFPPEKAIATTINGRDISQQPDTLRAGDQGELEGVVRDNNGQVLNNFQGTAYLSLFDKPRNVTTLANDPSSIPEAFPDQENILFRGKASVQNGKFIFRFRMPKDINYQYGNGKISLYAQDGSTDGNGYSTNVIIGGISSTIANDNQGPEIKASLNDDRFVNGSITNSTPVLLIGLADSSGINTAGAGLGHDLTATLDNDNNQYFVLNNFFETDLDNFQKGSLRFQLPELSAGRHTLKIKAWDLLNNSSESQLDFEVVNNNELTITHVLNYPNPFTTHTSFWFEHNYPATDLQVRIEIFTVSGKLIKTLAQTINTPGNRSNEIEWDGKDAYGQRLGKGVYLYSLSVRTPQGKSAQKWERLVILGK